MPGLDWYGSLLCRRPPPGFSVVWRARRDPAVGDTDTVPLQHTLRGQAPPGDDRMAGHGAVRQGAALRNDRPLLHRQRRQTRPGPGGYSPDRKRSLSCCPYRRTGELGRNHDGSPGRGRSCAEIRLPVGTTRRRDAGDLAAMTRRLFHLLPVAVAFHDQTREIFSSLAPPNRSKLLPRGRPPRRQ